MSDVEKILAGEEDIKDCNIENDFDNEEIEELIAEGIVAPRQLSQWRASDLIIDGILSYEEYPFDNFSSYEQLRQLEQGAISMEMFFKLADLESFDEEEKAWLKDIMEKLNERN